VKRIVIDIKLNYLITFSSAYQWVTCKSRDPLPLNAVLAGWDYNEKELYIGRFWHDGDVLPAKVHANEQSMVVLVSATHNEREVKAKYFQVSVHCSIHFVV
jgi:lysophospholipid acyltransferase (LPLAT)-like uncharacterized protein